jgi:hypothetical protein
MDTAVVSAPEVQGEGATEIIDFLRGEDQLVILYPDGSDAALSIGIENLAEETRVLLDGVIVALLPAETEIGLDDIALMPETAMEAELYHTVYGQG